MLFTAESVLIELIVFTAFSILFDFFYIIYNWLYIDCIDYTTGSFLSFLILFTAGSILMATDKKNRYMATGDVDGVIKVWDISEYCVQASDDVITTSPRK